MSGEPGRERKANRLVLVFGAIGAIVGIIGAWTGIAGYRMARQAQLRQDQFEARELLDEAWDVLDQYDEGWLVVQTFESPSHEREIEKKIERAQQLTPEDPEVYLCMGIYRAALGESEAAVAQYEKALDLTDGIYPPARANLALERAHQGELDEALAMLEAALEAEPESASLYTNLCFVRSLREELEEAGQACARARELDRRHIPAYAGLATVLFAQGHPTAAGEVLDEALSLNPTSAGLLANRALVYDVLGNEQEARSMLVAALRLDPSNALVRKKLAESSRQEEEEVMPAEILELTTQPLIESH